MTCPQVTVHGTDLPTPIDGIDTRESHEDGTLTLYPERFAVSADTPFLTAEYREPEGLTQTIYIQSDQIDSIVVTHDHDHDN